MLNLIPEKKDSIRQKLAKYKWYHRIQIADDLYTLPEDDQGVLDMAPVWDLVLRGMEQIDFKGKRVLDIGCRDGLFCLEAEKRGALEVVGIDNDLSRGTVEYLFPLLESKVQLYEMNLYDMDPENMGYFDVILFPGVLYHLRHPFWGLKRIIECLCYSGVLLVESAMLSDPNYQDHSFLYCPGFDEDPLQDATCCTLFNFKGLVSAMESMCCKFTWHSALNFDIPEEDRKGLLTNRQVTLFERDPTMMTAAGMEWLDSYWHGTHKYHSLDSAS